MAQEGRSEVLFLARNRLYFYDGSNVLTLELPQIIVHDLDVKDHDGLFNLITLFIKDNKLVPAQLYFVLSEAVREPVRIGVSFGGTRFGPCFK